MRLSHVNEGGGTVSISVITPVVLCIKADGLDPITLVLVDYRPGEGKVIVECYSEAWAHYWGGMGDKTVAQFIALLDASYLTGKLLLGKSDKRGYVRRIAQAVIDAMKEHVQSLGVCVWVKDGNGYKNCEGYLHACPVPDACSNCGKPVVVEDQPT